MGCLVSLVVCFLSQVFCFLAATNLLKTPHNTYALALAPHAVTCLIGDFCNSLPRVLSEQSDVHLLLAMIFLCSRSIGERMVRGVSGEVEGVPQAVPEVDGEELAEERGRLP